MKKKNLTTSEQTFRDEIKSSFIFHIPHSKTLIPDYTGFDLSLINKEIHLLTDHATDEIFFVPDTNRLIFPFSRIFCDVERLPDDKEELFQFGRGFYYTNTDSSLNLRELNDKHKEQIFNEVYSVHHNKLFNKVSQSLIDTGMATIIDCHSFSDIPFESDINKETLRPDICIGVDSVHTPTFLRNLVVNTFKRHNLIVSINSPYSGTIIPLKYSEDERVHSIMIEINRKLYMNDGLVNFEKVAWLNSIVREIFE